MHCPGHDPLLIAGSTTCRSCGTVNYPASAEWMSGSLILATFDPEHEPGCTNRGNPQTILIDLDAETQGVPGTPRPRRCRGTTAAGNACKAYPQPGSGFCGHHNPARRPALWAGTCAA
jgi:hypothetical protein